jgi:hypothetical protein
LQQHLDKIPAWLKSLWDMENELRSAARNGLILRSDEASTHLGKARQHLEKAMNQYYANREASCSVGSRPSGVR